MQPIVNLSYKGIHKKRRTYGAIIRYFKSIQRRKDMSEKILNG
jgi:hypothetical protein